MTKKEAKRDDRWSKQNFCWNFYLIKIAKNSKASKRFGFFDLFDAFEFLNLY